MDSYFRDKMIRLIRYLFINRQFRRYIFTGGLSTCIHWGIFFLLTLTFSMGQGIANLIAFSVAVTSGFFCNARWTFSATASLRRYVIYSLFMAFIAGMLGWGAQRLNINPVFTLCLFSGISLVCGYLYSRFIVFRNKAS